MLNFPMNFFEYIKLSSLKVFITKLQNIVVTNKLDPIQDKLAGSSPKRYRM